MEIRSEIADFNECDIIDDLWNSPPVNSVKPTSEFRNILLTNKGSVRNKDKKNFSWIGDNDNQEDGDVVVITPLYKRGVSQNYRSAKQIPDRANLNGAQRNERLERSKFKTKKWENRLPAFELRKMSSALILSEMLGKKE